MKAAFIAFSIALTSLSATYAQQGTNADRLSLTLQQVVVLVNEGTQFQVNWEKRDYGAGDKILCPTNLFTLLSLTQSVGTKERPDVGLLPPGSMDRLLEQKADAIEQPVLNLLQNASDYTVVRSNRLLNLLPRVASESRTPDPLDYVVPFYSVAGTNLFSALFVLCMSVPFTIEIVEPVVVSRGHPPDLRFDYPHWPLPEMPIVSLTASNAAVRSILSALINPQKKAYWVASPPFPWSVKGVRTNLPILEIGIYYPLQSRSIGLQQ